jgi:hypothetical protein
VGLRPAASSNDDVRCGLERSVQTSWWNRDGSITFDVRSGLLSERSSSEGCCLLRVELICEAVVPG